MSAAERVLAMLSAGQTDEAIRTGQNILRDRSTGLADSAQLHLLLSDILAQSDPAKATAHAKEAVGIFPDDPIANFQYATLLQQQGRLRKSVPFIVKACKGATEDLRLFFAAVELLSRASAHRELIDAIDESKVSFDKQPALIRMKASSHFELGDRYAAYDTLKSTQIPPVNDITNDWRELLMSRARLGQQILEFDDALQDCLLLLSRDGGDAEPARIAATIAIWLGDKALARSIVTKAIEINPDDAELLTHFLTLNPQSIGQDELARLQQVSRKTTDRKAAVTLQLAIARHYDVFGDYEKSWNVGETANRDLPGTFDIDQYRADFESALAASLKFRESGLAADTMFKRIYLCGAPRTGGSLVQSILAASPDVLSVGERGALVEPLQSLGDRPMEDETLLGSLRDLVEADDRGLRRLATVHSTIVDKTPHNILIAPWLALPIFNGKLVILFRNPADVSISIWMRPFPETFEYATRIDDICTYLEFQVDAISRLRAEGIGFLAMAYEDFVSDPKGHARIMFDYLDMPFDEKFLDPAKRLSPVPTFSAIQARGDIAKPEKSWERFERQIRPWRDRFDAISKSQTNLITTRP